MGETTRTNPDPSVVLFVENLKRLKQATKTWAREKQLKDDQHLRDIDLELAELQDGTGWGFYSQEAKDHLYGLEKRRRVILEEREAQWRLKSRALWLACGDENTKLFQAFSKGRKMANTIWSLRDQRGEEVTNFNELADLGTNHFKALFKAQEETSIAEIIKVAQLFPRFVEEDEVGSLTTPVTEKELIEVLHSFQKGKSPGPDGWPIEFYLGCFDILGSDLLKVIEESRVRGHIHNPINATFIALIPKTDNPSSFEDFRPISLCNCLYKIISKVISRRLKVILSKHISGEQFGFLEGRQIHEAIGVAQEGLHNIKLKKLKAVVIKIDLSKAFDRVNWLYIRMLLIHLGFRLVFVNWIMACLNSVSFSILLNGSATAFFQAERGIRQGCPLSPLTLPSCSRRP
jgi:hypothetical protein